MAPGPPGQEDAVRDLMASYIADLGVEAGVDAKGNLLAYVGDPNITPRIVVTAHMDEIAMMVHRINDDGTLAIGSLGGLYPWKCGEGPVEVLLRDQKIPGILSFGSIHTNDPSSRAQRAREHALEWDSAEVFTGLTAADLRRCGVRPGSRVVLGPTRRQLIHFEDFVSGPFLDDRADLVAMLLVIEAVRDRGVDVLFAATVSEEVGGEGALYLMQNIRPEICIALELGPITTDAPAKLTSTPTVWVTDSYSSTLPADLDLLASVGHRLGMELQFQAFSRGGSDASCAAHHGVCARPITLGLPIENSHGFEIMHEDAITDLARLTEALLLRI